jgi:hypothetical protein
MNGSFSTKWRKAILIVLLLVATMASQLYLQLGDGGGHPNTKHAALFERKLEETITDVILLEGKTKDVVVSKLSLLSCDYHGGPPNEMAAEMVYWRQQQNSILDTKFNSPFRRDPANPKYLTFTPGKCCTEWNSALVSLIC